ncbi:hypothetical protein MAV3388_00085 [Mycobacterium avium subsp. hominissuis 3388]|nr:hypothetical protein MAV3388_00085 [Mycobacterium avium subsp. hominissuis 3388]
MLTDVTPIALNLDSRHRTSEFSAIRQVDQQVAAVVGASIHLVHD